MEDVFEDVLDSPSLTSSINTTDSNVEGRGRAESIYVEVEYRKI